LKDFSGRFLSFFLQIPSTFIAEFTSRQVCFPAPRASDLELVSAFVAEFGTNLILVLTVGAFHVDAVQRKQGERVCGTAAVGYISN
jgi:hypothetical protein